MRGMSLSLCLLMVSVGIAPLHAQSADDAAGRLQGTWSAIKAERDGEAADDIVGHRLSFSGNRFQIRSKDGRTLFEGVFRTGQSAKPATIDFEHTGQSLKGKAWKGIYALEGDTLRICDNAPDPDKARPGAFEAKAGSGYVLITLTRAKP